MTLKNGLIIHFIGADNVDKEIGVTCHGLVMTEVALISAKFYKLFRLAVAENIRTNKGFILLISTPRGLYNWFTQLFIKYLPNKNDSKKLKDIKQKWYLDILSAKNTYDFEGRRIVIDLDLEEEKIAIGEEEYK